jgi:hypothetical protein
LPQIAKPISLIVDAVLAFDSVDVLERWDSSDVLDELVVSP